MPEPRSETSEPVKSLDLTPDDIRIQAEKKFGVAIFMAAQAYEQELKRLASESGVKVKDVPYTVDYGVARTIAAFLGDIFCHDRTAREQQTLARLHFALRPPIDGRSTGKAVELADSIVEDYARLYALEGANKDKLARFLPLHLASEVDPAFKKLVDDLDKVAELLARFTTSKGRKTKQTDPSKLTSEGILCKLNELTNWPLGKGLNVNGVESAVKRFGR